MAVLFLWILFFFWWDFFFLFLFVGGVSCVFYLYYARLWFRLFWACESLEVSLAGRVIFFLSAWGSAVWSVGPVYFIWALAGVDGGTVQVFFSGLCCGGYGTVEMVGGCGPFFLCFLQFFVCCCGGRLSVVGSSFLINFYLGLFWYICRFCGL
jgi:hypothetical protein